MKTIVSLFWYFYVAWGPAITFAGAYFSAFRQWPFRNRLIRYVIVSAALTLLAGPASEEGWVMTWWMVPVISAPKKVTYYVWQYALFCLVVQAVLEVVAHWVKSGRDRY